MASDQANGRHAAFSGVRAILPLAAGIFPFGLVYGVAVADSSVANWLGGTASTFILAGASQVALVELIDQGTPWLVAVGTALVINLRFAMYSAALAPAFSGFAPGVRVAVSHLMTDQAAVTALLYNQDHPEPTRRLFFYLGAGGFFALAWAAGTWIGIAFGTSIPETWQLGFVIPLMFLALLVPSIRDAPGLVAAGVGGTVTLLARGVPFNLGLLVGAVTGVIAGLWVDR